MVTEISELEFIDSMHEQREYNHRIVPCIGAWIEKGIFTPVIETFDIKKRYFCKDMKLDEAKMELTAILEEMNVEQMNKESEELVEKILNKHGESLIGTLRFMVIHGIYENRGFIEQIIKKLDRPLYNEMLLEREKKKLAKNIENTEIKLQLLRDEAKALENNDMTLFVGEG